MLIDNRNFLRLKNRDLLNILNNTTENKEIKSHIAKSGLETLTVTQNETEQFIHSAYDPSKEVETLVKKYKEVLSEGDSIIFVGIGLGYHIPEFVKVFKPEHYSLLELNPSILSKALETINLTDQAYKALTNVHLAESEDQFIKVIKEDLQNINASKLVILPSYTRIFKEKVNTFTQLFKKTLINQKDRLHTNASFQTRWIINSLRNLPYVLSTSNLIHDVNTGLFKDKPAIIVSAGPSLDEEIEVLKKIKKDQSAYIFSVGSAINALIEHDIYPDAAFTYDPKEKNQYVFEKLKQRKINEIPLIFGSSVGYETLHNYPGDMLHFLTSQDTISSNLLNKNQLETIPDAPSIAVIALQVLSKKGCNPIVFVGQNLSYSNVRYAAGIEYGWLDNQLSQDELEETFEVESVNGGKVRTKMHMIRMREALEHYIKLNSDIKFYNSTKNGAKINYTEFISLKDLSEDFEPNVIERTLLKTTKNTYDQNMFNKRFIELINQQKDIESQLFKVSEAILEYSLKVSSKQSEKHFNELLNKINNSIHKIEDSSFYKIFLGPMSRHELEILSASIKKSMNLTDNNERTNAVVQQYKYLIKTWNGIIKQVSHHIKEVEQELIG